MDSESRSYDSYESSSSEDRNDRTYGQRPSYRGRRYSRDDDQPVGSRRRRRIGEMRPGEGTPSSASRRYDRGGEEDSSYPRRSYDRPGRPYRSYDEGVQEDGTDYKERYKEKFESNRRRYTEEGSGDSGRESAGYYRRPSGDSQDSYQDGGRSGYNRRSGGSYRQQGERGSYGTRPRRRYGDQEGGDDRRGPRRSYGPKGSNRGPRNGAPRQGGARGRQNNAKRKPVQPTYEQPELSADEPIRLNKFIANSGVCSRREADDLIAAGAVLVNGVPVTTLGTKVTINDRIEVNRQEVKPEKKVYVLLNKPRNCVTTSDDPQERMTVVNLVRSAAKERIYPVGRLDRNTTGVLLLTNDGELAAKLVHPSFEKKKIYHAWLDREVTPEDMQKLADGIELEDGEMHADAISYVTDEDHSQVGIEIHSGRNRIVRRLFEALGYRVVKLDRVYFAGLTKKNLGRGKWRYLTQEEVDNLKMGAFE